MDRQPASEFELFTDKEAAAFLRMSQVTLWRQRKGGRISFRRCAGKILYSKHDLSDYLDRAKRGFDQRRPAR